MATKIKAEFYCEKHFEERTILLFEKKERYVLDIVGAGAALAFGPVGLQGVPTGEKCKAPGCKQEPKFVYIRTDFYEGEDVPEPQEVNTFG